MVVANNAQTTREITAKDVALQIDVTLIERDN